MFEKILQEAREQLLVAKILTEIVVIWIISNIGYYSLVAIAGAWSDYSDRPFLVAAYYLLWVGATLSIFWNFFKERKVVEVRLSALAAWFLGALGVALYLGYIFPLFPAIHWASLWGPPSELLVASSWYFLPKSIDIALQQVLLAAMVFAFDMRKLSLFTTALWSAALFGSIHLLLVFGGASLAYTAFFTVSAVVAGFIFPYLMLRVRNGFVYSYFLHWGFYALVIVLARAVFKL